MTLGPSQLESGEIFMSLTCADVLDLRPIPVPCLEASDVSLLNIFLLKLPDEMQSETQINLNIIISQISHETYLYKKIVRFGSTHTKKNCLKFKSNWASWIFIF